MTATELYVPAADNTLSFDIPEDLHNSSLQLIWTKSNHIPCVCPVTPDLTSDCACNKNDPENLGSMQKLDSGLDWTMDWTLNWTLDAL